MDDEINTAEEVAFYLSDTVRDALYAELDVTPKPGLVDKSNSGAHKDMDYDSFCLSIEAITPYFYKMCLVALERNDCVGLAAAIRLIGLNAERAMKKATNGANTHRGAIFSLGLFVSGLCMDLASGFTLRKICYNTASLAAQLDHTRFGGDSNGRQVARKYGVPTAMDYAKQGFYGILPDSLNAMKNFLSESDTVNEARIKTLLFIMSRIEDSNVYHRGGAEGAEFVKIGAMRLLGDFSVEGVKEFDRQLIERNISCGGSADMLALCLFVDKLRSGSSLPLLS